MITALTVWASRRLRKLWMSIQQGLGVLGVVIQENLVGHRVVRAFAREKYEEEKFRKQASFIYDREIEANNLLASNSPVMSFALLLAMGAILWYGGRQVAGGQLSAGQLTQFLLYSVMLAGPVRMIGWLTILYSRAMSSGQRVFEVLDQSSPVKEKLESPSTRPRLDGHVRFENVSFNYDSSGTVLKDIDFEAKPGQIIALVGATGSGKSTVANLIPRFYDVTRGRITVDDRDIRDYSLASLRRHIGIVHQDTFLFSATIRENIAYGKPDATMDEIIAVARTVRLHDFITGLPDGYDTWVGERGITLSGGQKQRLAIARTLLVNPRIIIMDDTTSSVDTETEYFIQQALASLLAGRTTFIIAQRLRSVQMADLILVLKDGQIVERGTHQELLGHGGFYQQLYSIQFQCQEGWSEPVPADVETELVEEPVPVANGTARTPLEGRLTSSLTRSDEVVFGRAYDSRVVARMVPYFARSKPRCRSRSRPPCSTRSASSPRPPSSAGRSMTTSSPPTWPA